MTHWKPTTVLELYGISEVLNIADFCELIKKGCFQKINLHFAFNSSVTFQKNFKAFIEEMKHTWDSELPLPIITYLNVTATLLASTFAILS